MAFTLKQDWPVLALGAGGVAIAYFASHAPAPGKSSAIWPRVVGMQRATPSRSSSKTTDSGTLASQVIGDVVNQQTAEDELQTEQNIAYRQSNTQAQLSLNSEVPPPNGWNQLFGGILNDLPMAFGFPPVGAFGGSSPGWFGQSPGGYGGGYGSSSGSGFLQWLYSLFQSGGGSAPAPSGPGPYNPFNGAEW